MISMLFSIFVALPVHAEVVEKTVAIVNNEIILESDFKELQKMIGKPGMIDEALLFDTPMSTLKKDRKAQMQYLINSKILDSEIKRLNLTVTEDRVNSELRDLAKRNRVTEAEMVKAIESQGITEREYRAFTKEKLEKESLMGQELISKLRISDEDALNEYLKTHPNSQPSIDEFSVSHILFSPKKGGAEAAYARAEAVLTKLRQGGDFEALAQQHSEDPNFTSGGSLGTFKSGDFLPEIETAISGLKVGETTPVVKSRIGFHIVKLTSKKLTTDPRFERAKEGIKANLLEKSFNRQLKLWLQTKKDEAFIRINE
ncbi:Chaperone SurA precursor [compost metagenome]